VSKPWQDLRVLIAGCGSIGKRHARILAELGLSDLRICDPSRQQRESLCAQTPVARAYADYSHGLADRPDAVFICTPPQAHVPMILQALDAGCHVFTEKPLSDTLSGVDELARRVNSSRKTVMVGLCFRFHQGLRRAKHLLDAGLIGRLISIRALMGEHLPDVRPDFRNLFTLKSSGAFDLMHDIDLAVWYAGRPVSAVKCICGAYSDIGFEAPDIVELLIGFENRCVASVHLDFFQRPRRRQMELIGADGCITVEFARWDQCTVSLFEAASGKWQRETFTTDRDDMFREEDEEFLRALSGGLPVSCPVSEARKSLEIVHAARNGV